MERRERDRVNVRLECRIEPAGLAECEPCSVTENISRTGMLIRWNREASAPAIGDRFIARLKLPRNLMFGQRCMLFEAQVVRVSECAGKGLLVAVTGAPLRFSRIEAPSLSRYIN